MAKRFAESKIWEDIWYQELPLIWKCVWKYLCDRCDEAGIWKTNFKLAEFQIGVKIKWDDVEKYLNKDKQRIDFYDGFWVIKDFVIFQYGEKVFTSPHGFHKKIRDMLDRVSHRVLEKRNTLQVKEEVKVKEEVISFRKHENLFLQEIIKDLNEVLGTNYKKNTKQTIELIQARINEGFTLEDFKVVHRKMFQSWGKDEKMAKFLRPITLYGNKFESYLNQKEQTNGIVKNSNRPGSEYAGIETEVSNDKTGV
jgi:uncharacterized phage protein (TIGR02220 family)